MDRKNVTKNELSIKQKTFADLSALELTAALMLCFASPEVVEAVLEA